MEELVNAIYHLAEVHSESLPLWANIVSILAPIVLTTITIVLSIRMDKQNRKLQIELSNRDQQNQTRQCVLDIYNSYYNALNQVGPVSDDVAGVFVSDQSYYNWANAVQQANVELNRFYNQAKLIIEDEELLETLKTARIAYQSISNEINEYIATGIPTQAISNAWIDISIQHNIQVGNYYILMQNPNFREEFVEQLKTTYTNKIQRSIHAFIDIVSAPSFDGPFNKYVQIKAMPQKRK